MMGDNIGKLNDILSILNEKHKNMENLMVFTKEMDKVVAANDLESLGAVLSMRKESMDKIDALNADISKILAGMDQPDMERAKNILAPDADPAIPGNRVETDILETNRMTRALLKKIIDLDKEINDRIKRDADVKA